jgi:hypothetical protein
MSFRFAPSLSMFLRQRRELMEAWTQGTAKNRKNRPVLDRHPRLGVGHEGVDLALHVILFLPQLGCIALHVGPHAVQRLLLLVVALDAPVLLDRLEHMDPQRRDRAHEAVWRIAQ